MGECDPGGRVLVVDDEVSVCSLLQEALRRQGYDCRSCMSAEQALQLLSRECFDVVVTDLYMPGISGLKLLEKGQELLPEAAFLMATGESDVRIGVEAMKLGAADYLVKPIQLAALFRSVSTAMEKNRARVQQRKQGAQLGHLVETRTKQLRDVLERLEQSYDETVEALGAALDFRDNEMGGHAQRVCRYSLEMARRMGYPEKNYKDILRGAYLHDVGKIGIPDEILFKPGKLTATEMEVMRGHVTIGHGLIARIPHLAKAAEIVLCHHERFDGNGYPNGLAGKEIPLSARIFSVADTLDAMTVDRPYRRALLLSTAREEITRQSGSQFDPDVVAVFLSVPDRVWEAIKQEVGDGEANLWNMAACLAPPALAAESGGN